MNPGPLDAILASLGIKPRKRKHKRAPKLKLVDMRPKKAPKKPREGKAKRASPAGSDEH